MFKVTVCYSLETLVNFMLSYDADSVMRLQALEDKIITLEFTDLQLKFYWLFENQRVRVLATWSGDVDANIAGSLEAITRLGFSRAKVAKDLTVSGDMHVVEAFKTLFAKLDIDWEAQLAPIIGDAFAFKIGRTARVANKWLKQAANSLQANTKDYLEEEKNLLPSRWRFTDFIGDVRELNRDVDKLAVRIKRLPAQDAT